MVAVERVHAPVGVRDAPRQVGLEKGHLRVHARVGVQITVSFRDHTLDNFRDDIVVVILRLALGVRAFGDAVTDAGDPDGLGGRGPRA